MSLFRWGGVWGSERGGKGGRRGRRSRYLSIREGSTKRQREKRVEESGVEWREGRGGAKERKEGFVKEKEREEGRNGRGCEHKGEKRRKRKRKEREEMKLH